MAPLLFPQVASLVVLLICNWVGSLMVKLVNATQPLLSVTITVSGPEFKLEKVPMDWMVLPPRT